MARRLRLDSELVRRGLARSRTHAAELITSGQVRVDGDTAIKPARQVDPAQAVVIEATAPQTYVSRGAHKLIGALDHLELQGTELSVTGRHALDAGASTGGFTDVLLRRGAASVVAIDVGYGQLAWALREDPRVTVMERTNVRTVEAGSIQPPPDLIVGDLSFISLTLVLPALAGIAAPEADYLLMVKPQFEVGKNLVGAGGVVRRTDHRHNAVRSVADAATELGLAPWAIAPSPLPGPAGNVEYFVALRAGHHAALRDQDLEDAIATAIAAGPTLTPAQSCHTTAQTQQTREVHP